MGQRGQLGQKSNQVRSLSCGQERANLGGEFECIGLVTLGLGGKVDAPATIGQPLSTPFHVRVINMHFYRGIVQPHGIVGPIKCPTDAECLENRKRGTRLRSGGQGG